MQLIVWAPTRERAIERMKRALNDTIITGEWQPHPFVISTCGWSLQVSSSKSHFQRCLSNEYCSETNLDIRGIVPGIPTTLDYHKLILDIQVLSIT